MSNVYPPIGGAVVLAVDYATKADATAVAVVKFREGTVHTAVVHEWSAVPAAPTGDLVAHELNRRMQRIASGQPVFHPTRAQRRAAKRAVDKQEKRGR